MKKIILVFLVIAVCSCNQENLEINDQLNYLPAVKESGVVSVAKMRSIKNFQLGKNARITQSLDYESAIRGVYEGHEGIELIYIPSTSNSSIFEVYVFQNGALVNNQLRIENYSDKMIVHSSQGTATIEIEGNLVKGGEISYNSASNGRVNCSASDLAGGFLDCTDAVIDQAREAFGDIGGLAFDIGCSLWVVCRGAFVVACSTIAIGTCDDDDSSDDNNSNS